MFNYTTKTDEEILDLAKNGEYSATFNQYWIGNVRKGWSDFEMDREFIQILAMYTRDPVQIDSLFRKSGRFRPDWDKDNGRSTYGQRVINGVLMAMGDVPVYDAVPKVEPELKPEPETEPETEPEPEPEKTRLWDSDEFPIIRKGTPRNSKRSASGRPKNLSFKELWEKSEASMAADPEWVFNNFMQTGGVTLLWGDKGSGKSKLCEQLCVILAHGLSFGPYQASQPASSLYFDAELSPAEARLNTQVIRKGLRLGKFGETGTVCAKVTNIRDDEDPGNDVEFEFETPEGRRFIEDIIRDAQIELPNLKLVVFDNIMSMGSLSSQQKAKDFMKWVKALAIRHGLHFLLVDHTTKRGVDYSGNGRLLDLASTGIFLHVNARKVMRLVIKKRRTSVGLMKFKVQQVDDISWIAEFCGSDAGSGTERRLSRKAQELLDFLKERGSVLATDFPKAERRSKLEILERLVVKGLVTKDKVGKVNRYSFAEAAE